METTLLNPGKLLTLEHDESELERLTEINSNFDRDISEKVKLIQTNNSKVPTGPEYVSYKALGPLQNIEKSDKDAFIGANALSMINGTDINVTDMLGLNYVVENASDYLVCAKSDGVRYLMFVSSHGKVYLNDRKNQFFEVKMYFPPFCRAETKEENSFVVNFIFDGELLVNKREAELLKKKPDARIKLHYLAFDCLKYNGEFMSLKKYDFRLSRIREFVNSVSLYGPLFKADAKTFCEKEAIKQGYSLEFHLKDFFYCSNIDFLLNSIVDSEALPHENDGLIFTKNNYPYLPGRNRGILKWKPNELNTVDFFVCENDFYHTLLPNLFKQDNFYVFELYTVYGDYFFFFDFLFVYEQEEYLSLMSSFRSVMEKDCYYGNIIECSYDHELTSQETRDFYDIVYQSDFDSIEQLVNQSKLHQLWLAKKGLPFSKDTPQTNNSSPNEHINKIYSMLEARNKEDGSIRGGWKVLRNRDDKNYPNNFSTAASMIDTIFKSNVSKDDLIQKFCLDKNRKQVKK